MTKKILKWVGVGLIIFSSLVIVGVGIISSIDNEPTLEANIAKHLGGYASDEEDSGVMKVTISDNDLLIDYAYYPVGITAISKEIGIELTSKIKTLYEKEYDVNKAIFNIYLPYDDRYGNITWKPTAGFTFTRSIYEKINWDNFSASDLLNIAEDVRVPN